MQFIFGTSESRNFKDFFEEIIEYLEEEEKNWVSDSKKDEYLKNNSESYFRFLYCCYGEEFIKYHIASNFDITFFDDLFESNEYINNLQIIKNYCSAYQRHNFFLVEEESRTIAVVDIVSEELCSWLETNLNVGEVEIQFAKKDDILRKIQDLFEIDLANLSVNPNKESKYSPSALNLNYSSKSSLIKIGFFLSLFILLSFKFTFFAVFAIAIFNSSYLISTFYKLFLSLSVSNRNENLLLSSESDDANKEKNQDKKPIYTILLPLLYEEKSIVMQLVSAIKNFNYQQHQLDVKLLLEESDEITSSIISSMKLDYNFDVILVPDSSKYGHPKTKARACNYGFNFAKGEYIVIYDGDDIPHPEQLSYSLKKFEENPDINIIQFSLNSYNRETNLFTKFYSLEFDAWYKIFLPSIKNLEMPVTLGGTSNHFRIGILKNNLWDSYNLTEDADLGIRLWLNGINNIHLTSEFSTMEEAPENIFAMIRQRSRWAKGFLQTYFVHIKYKFTDNFQKKAKFLGFMNLFMFLPIFANLSFLPNIFEFLVLKFFHHQGGLATIFGGTTLVLFLISFVFQILPLIIHRDKMLIKLNLNVILFPIYSIFLNVCASYKAIWQFFAKPFYWEKTMHGINAEKINKD